MIKKKAKKKVEFIREKNKPMRKMISRSNKMKIKPIKKNWIEKGGRANLVISTPVSYSIFECKRVYFSLNSINIIKSNEITSE